MGKTILVADDDEIMRAMMVDVLSDRLPGVKVVEAANGAEALRLSRNLLPDLIVMDIQMPVMDGLQASLALGADPKTSLIPIIAISGNMGRGVSTASFPWAVILFKPFSSEELVSVVKRYL
ncbi:MAG: response regulator [Bacteroidota bacterium]